jgi:predicted thioesterase
MSSKSVSFEAIQPGLKGEIKLVVAEEHTAKHLGSGSVSVLATPQMVLLMERAGVAAVDHLLPDGYRTVGGHLDIRHLAPTPVGFEVTATAELVEVEGRRLTFHVRAHDGVELVGDGSHQRFIIDMQRFGEQVAQKAG